HLSEKQVNTIAIIRKGKISTFKKLPSIHLIEAEVTEPKTLQGIFKGIDVFGVGLEHCHFPV
ncbi:MAG: hypothetical protein ACOC4R_01920, partial [Bacteroidota bacterium]